MMMELQDEDLGWRMEGLGDGWWKMDPLHPPSSSWSSLNILLPLPSFLFLREIGWVNKHWRFIDPFFEWKANLHLSWKGEAENPIHNTLSITTSAVFSAYKRLIGVSLQPLLWIIVIKVWLQQDPCGSLLCWENGWNSFTQCIMDRVCKHHPLQLICLFLRIYIQFTSFFKFTIRCLLWLCCV